MFRSLAAIRKAFAARPAALKRTKGRNTKESAPLEFDRRLGCVAISSLRILTCHHWSTYDDEIVQQFSRVAGSH
jgi:hypothetical protein